MYGKDRFPKSPIALDRRHVRALFRIYAKRTEKNPRGVSSAVVDVLVESGFVRRHHLGDDTTEAGARLAKSSARRGQGAAGLARLTQRRARLW